MLSATAYYRYETESGSKAGLGQNFLDRGVYSGTNSYAPLDVVSLDGGSALYVSLASSTGISPPQGLYGANWAALVEVPGATAAADSQPARSGATSNEPLGYGAISATAYYRYETSAGSKTRLGQNFLYRGVYASDVTYAPLDVVSLGSVLYTALVQNSGVFPTQAVYDSNWAVLIMTTPARMGSAITIDTDHSPYNVQADVRRIYAAATSGDIVINLEEAPFDERVITIKTTVPLANLGYTVTINGSGHDIDVAGQTTYVLAQNYESITFEFSTDSNRWQI